MGINMGVDNARKMKDYYKTKSNRVLAEYRSGKLPLELYLRDTRRFATLQQAWEMIERHNTRGLPEGQLEIALSRIQTDGYSIFGTN